MPTVAHDYNIRKQSDCHYDENYSDDDEDEREVEVIDIDGEGEEIDVSEIE